MKPETKKRFDWIKKIEAEWEKRLGLEDWDIRVEIRKKIQGGEPGSGTCGKCWSTWHYKQATIQLRKKDMLAMDERSVEAVVVHELIHCVTNEMRYYSTDTNHDEAVVTNLVNAFMRVAGK
jgi:hypothetical protein